MDLCNCATRIAQAACPSCVVSQINGTMKYASVKRLQKAADGSNEVVCKCGKPVGGCTVRQCVYCKGIVTAPFRNFGGQTLVYRPDTAAPRVLGDDTGSAYGPGEEGIRT